MQGASGELHVTEGYTPQLRPYVVLLPAGSGCLAAYGAAWAVGAEQWRPLTGVVACLGLLQVTGVRAVSVLVFPRSCIASMYAGHATSTEFSRRCVGVVVTSPLALRGVLAFGACFVCCSVASS